MSQTIKIRRGTKAQLNSRGALQSGELGFCTDTKEVFIGDGAQNVFVGRVMQGTYVARPNAAEEGRFYFVTSGENSGYIYMDDGTTWHRVNSKALADLSGNLDNIIDGSTYGKVRNTELTSGKVNRLDDGSNNVTASEVKTHIADSAKHRTINDSIDSSTNLWSSQKVKSEIYNAIRGLEWQDSIISKAVSAPPASPSNGDRYLVPSGATGEWSSKTNQIAHRNNGAWEYYAPTDGWSIYVDAENKNYVFNGTSWVRSGEANQSITAGNGLTGGGSGDSINLAVGVGNGITVGTDSVSAKAGNGITVDSTGINVNVDGVSLILDGGNGNKITVAEVDGGTF